MILNSAQRVKLKRETIDPDVCLTLLFRLTFGPNETVSVDSEAIDSRIVLSLTLAFSRKKVGLQSEGPPGHGFCLG